MDDIEGKSDKMNTFLHVFWTNRNIFIKIRQYL